VRDLFVECGVLAVYRDAPRPADRANATLYEKRLFHSPDQAVILVFASYGR
jgi:hypothetical protein